MARQESAFRFSPSSPRKKSCCFARVLKYWVRQDNTSLIRRFASSSSNSCSTSSSRLRNDSPWVLSSFTNISSRPSKTTTQGPAASQDVKACHVWCEECLGSQALCMQVTTRASRLSARRASAAFFRSK